MRQKSGFDAVGHPGVVVARSASRGARFFVRGMLVPCIVCAVARPVAAGDGFSSLSEPAALAPPSPGTELTGVDGAERERDELRFELQAKYDMDEDVPIGRVAAGYRASRSPSGLVIGGYYQRQYDDEVAELQVNASVAPGALQGRIFNARAGTSLVVQEDSVDDDLRWIGSAEAEVSASHPAGPLVSLEASYSEGDGSSSFLVAGVLSLSDKELPRWASRIALNGRLQYVALLDEDDPAAEAMMQLEYRLPSGVLSASASSSVEDFTPTYGFSVGLLFSGG